MSRRGVHGAVVDALGRRIAAGLITPDTTLVPDAIGDEFGVSRTVVRETLRVLEAKGMVTARPNIGTRVLDETQWHALDPDLIGWQLAGPDPERTTERLVEMRRALEPFAASLAAERATAAQIAAITDAWHALEAADRANEPDAIFEADVDFHRALLHAAGNPLLSELSSLVEVALSTRREIVAREGFAPGALAAHGAVAAAVEEHDAALASQSMLELIRRSEREDR